MDIIKYDPLKGIEKTLEGLLKAPDAGGYTFPYIKPLTDIHETEKEVVVTAEIPGVDKKDINVNITEDRIEISLEQKKEFKEEKEGFFRSESSYSEFYESLRLPSAVDASKAETTFKNGVLEVVLPKIKKDKVKVK